MTDSIVAAPRVGTLAAEHYQTFEMAKEHDTVLGGDNIAQIRSYAAYARAQAQAIHKTIAATSGIEDVAAIKAEAVETEQTFAKVGIYADQRIGEILRELPKAKNQHDESLVDTPTKRQAEKQAGISHAVSIDLQAMAANPDVVQAVLDRATQEGKVVSRAQVLKAIDERKRAERELRQASVSITNAQMEAESLRQQVADARAEIDALEAQADREYDAGFKAGQGSREQPRVVERTVEVSSDDDKRRIAELERQNGMYSDDNTKLKRQLEAARKELDQAKLLLGEKGRTDNARWDISALTTATNSYLSQYGGKAWAFDQFGRVDEPTQREFVKAITSLAGFAQNMVEMIRDLQQSGDTNE